MGKERTKKLVLSAMFMAIGLVLPFFTGQIHAIGKMLLPMHIPVLLCGLICGWPYGLVVGFILPLFRSLLFSMPVMYPNAIGMAFELATYGVVSGLLYKGKKGTGRLYKSIIISMVSGRIVWGVANGILLGMSGETFTLSMFVQVALFEAIPGIIIQMVLIPVVVSSLEYSKRRKEEKENEKVSVQK